MRIVEIWAIARIFYFISFYSFPPIFTVVTVPTKCIREIRDRVIHPTCWRPSFRFCTRFVTFPALIKSGNRRATYRDSPLSVDSSESEMRIEGSIKGRADAELASGWLEVEGSRDLSPEAINCLYELVVRAIFPSIPFFLFFSFFFFFARGNVGSCDRIITSSRVDTDVDHYSLIDTVDKWF